MLLAEGPALLASRWSPATVALVQRKNWRAALPVFALTFLCKPQALLAAPVGVAALAILAAFVPRDQGRPVVAPLSQELAVLRRSQVWLGLGITVFGFAGVFTLYTYIEPLLRQVTHMSDGWVTATLLVFGAGLAAGNLLGGRLADKGVLQALAGSIGALLVTLALGRWAFGQAGVAMSYVVLLGTVAFATVAPMQMRVLQQAGAAGANLASSLNISAFNLGNAIGAWLGGVVIDAGWSLQSIPLVAAGITLAALALTAYTARLDRPPVASRTQLVECEAG